MKFIFGTSPRKTDVAEVAPEVAAPAAVRQQVSVLNKDLDEAARKFERLQAALARQDQLEQLLKQGRVHLQDLRSGLQQMTIERDRLQATLNEGVDTHQLELEEHRKNFSRVATERDRLTAEIQEREASHTQYVLERADERATFERLLGEARANQRDIMQELDEQAQQNKILRDAAMRAQALVRRIMDAQEPAPPESDSQE